MFFKPPILTTIFVSVPLTIVLDVRLWLIGFDDGVPLRHNSPQPSASSVDRYFVWSTILTGLKRLRKMSLYSKGLRLIFLRPNFFFEGLGCGLPQPRPSLKKKLRLSPMLYSIFGLLIFF